MFRIRINLKTREAIEKAIKICGDIAEKDNTFTVTMKTENEIPYLYMDSPTKDIAHKRGIIFTKNYLKEFNLGYDPLFR